LTLHLFFVGDNKDVFDDVIKELQRLTREISDVRQFLNRLEDDLKQVRAFVKINLQSS